MAHPLHELLRLGPARRARLDSAGIAGPEDLLRRCRTAVERRRFHDETGLGPDQLLDWALTLDLARLSGIDAELASLLRAAGVEGIASLRHRHAGPLSERLRALAPLRTDLDDRSVERWIAEAHELPTLVHL